MATVTRRRTSSAAPWWRGFAVGLGSGVLLSVTLYFTAGPGSEPGAGNALTQAAGPASGRAVQSAAAGPVPKFEFFTVLPDQEVPVPEAQVAQASKLAGPLANGAPAIRVLTGRAQPPAPAPVTSPPPSAAPSPNPASAPAAASPTPAPLPSPPVAKTPAPVPPVAAAAPTPGRAGQYMLQAGSFRGSADADRVKARLALSGVRADVQPVTVNGATWYRVRVGPFASLDELGKTRTQLQSTGLPTMVLKLRAGT